jgi:pimeloyl-ACP methyl ester carboxylesterase
MESGYIPLSEGKLFYERQGNGTPIVLVHSGFLDRRMWDPQFARFSQEYSVIRYDQRGHGRSSVSESLYGDFEDLGALVDHLEVGEVFLIGISDGARIAAAFAAGRPGAIRGLVLAGGCPGDLDPTPEEEQRFLDTLPEREGRIVALAQAGKDDEAVAAMLVAWAPAVDEVTRGFLRPIARENLGAFVALSTGRHALRKPPYPVAETLRTNAIPTLLLVGEQDHPALGMMMGRFAQQLPNAKFLTLPRADHTANLSDRDGFDRGVLDFLGGVLHPAPAPAA